jgi:SAM-dependent methyltransferase
VPGRDDWESVARASDDDELRERILTGFKAGKPFTPYRPTIALREPFDRVLDFGCGAGRNFPYLKSIARVVCGFDLPPMIDRCRRLAAVEVDELVDDWAAVRGQRFDLIFASLVLQHIEPERTDAYLNDFARMAPTVYLLTRTDSDFGTRVLDAVRVSGLFDAGTCVRVDHDPATDQLRVLGEAPVSNAAAEAGAHFEVLLHSRAFGAGL